MAGTLSAAQGDPPGMVVSKTLRVDHGRPVVVVSENSVLVLEFKKEPIAEALVSHPGEDIRHCRAKYRYRVYHDGSVTNGEGMVEEIFQTVRGSANGRQVKDVGSRTGISAGEFHLGWSEGGAGGRSWIYYRADSPIRFIQQPQQVTFESMDRDQFRRYLASRNVREFVEAGRTVQVIGPAVFSGDMPTEAPVSARIESGRVRDGAFELRLSNLATNRHYLIESSFEPKTGGWNPVHTFIAQESRHEWSDPLSKDIDVMFYRIREGAY
jgi:hypothetical protein